MQSHVDRTRTSLLLRVKNEGDDSAWREFVGLYRPLLMRYARARGIGPTDAEDVAQFCLAVITRKMASFDYDRASGGFKRWLRTIVNNRVRQLWRGRRESPAKTGDFDRSQHRERSPEETWEQIWLEEHLKYCLARVRPRVEAKTFEAFQRVVLDEQPVQDVCDALGITANQVYIAKSRVTRRLRDVMTELIDDHE